MSVDAHYAVTHAHCRHHAMNSIPNDTCLVLKYHVKQGKFSGVAPGAVASFLYPGTTTMDYVVNGKLKRGVLLLRSDAALTQGYYYRDTMLQDRR